METAFSFFHAQSGCNRRALWAGTRDRWLAAGNSIRHRVPGESERPGTTASREATGLCKASRQWSEVP